MRCKLACSRALLYLHLVFAVYFPIVIDNYIYYYIRTVWNGIQSINNNEHTSMCSCSSFFFFKKYIAHTFVICDELIFELYIFFASIVFAFFIRVVWGHCIAQVLDVLAVTLIRNERDTDTHTHTQRKREREGW